MLDVHVGGVHFEGYPRNLDSAFVISPDGWSGWDDGPSVRREDVSRPGSHGSFVAPGFRSARVVSISGWIVARSAAELLAMRDQLMGVLADGGQGRMTVQRGSDVTWADVQLSDMPTVRVRGASETEAEFQIIFWAADPFKYGEKRTYASTSPVFHYGNAPAWPVIVVPSAPASYDITSNGRLFRVVGAPSGGTHRVDMRTGRVTRDGVPVVGAVTRAETWPVGRGERVSFTMPAGSIEVHDTFM